MPEPVMVTSPLDHRLEPFTSLNDAARRDRIERRLGIFTVEGITAIARLIESPYPVRAVLLSAAKYDRLASALAGTAAPVFVAEQAVLAGVVGFNLHRGAVAIADRLPLRSVEELARDARCLVVTEGLNDHENLGAIARSAVALGADALLLDPTSADPLYRRTVRVSMGEVLRLPYTRLDEWPRALERLRDDGFTLVALTPAAAGTPIGEIAPPDRVALLLGSEAAGLSPAVRALVDADVRIPIRAGVDSLNVGHAAAIALHRLAHPS